MEQNFRFKPIQRILILILSMMLFTIIASLIISIVTNNGITTQSLRISTVIQDCLIFIVPAIVSAICISGLPAKFLGLDQKISFPFFILSITALLAFIPTINILVDYNENISFPESLKSIEEWMRESENRAQSSVKILLGGDSVASLIVNILIVGILAGFSEEIFFRGALQQIILSFKSNHHLAIWITAIIFSAFHLQFFGFIPRLLLGAFFGYLMYWSGSIWLPAIIHALNNSLVVLVSMGNSNNNLADGVGVNSFGQDSPILILASVVLTAFIISKMNKLSIENHHKITKRID